MKKCYLLLLVILVPTLVFSQGFKGKTAIGLQGGYWIPSFDLVNEGLEEVIKDAENQGVDVSGESEIGGAIDFGASLYYGLGQNLYLRAEGFYWNKSNTITLSSQGISADIDYKFTLIPAMLSGLVYLSNDPNNLMLYVGGGAGVVFVTSEASSSLFGQDISEKETGNDIMYQVLGGLEFPYSTNMSFFVEGRYMIGQYSQEEENDITGEMETMDVSLSGLQVMGGIKFNFGN